MGIYSHLTVEQLTARRAELSDALQALLVNPSSASSSGRSASFQQKPADLRREIEAIGAELSRRDGCPAYGPIYMV